MDHHEARSRRSFLKKGAMAGVAASFGLTGMNARGSAPARGIPSPQLFAGPVAISSRNGRRSVERAVEMIRNGADALDAVISGVNLVEEDPEDTSVGYGGLPNERGVVQLDSAVMHGPTCRAGAVAALEGIMYPSKVARLVLQRTDHCLLVGQGARDFAVMHGFEPEDLLTEKARQEWVKWKESLSKRDDYLPPHGAEDRDLGALHEEAQFHYGTIHCSAIDLAGNISSVTTTSGLSYKIPGRVGDSPIIGAGLYVDNEVGAAGSTGRGEANLENLSCYLIVERMRLGDSPEEACLYACRRIAEHTKLARLLDSQGRPDFNVNFYALNKAGDVGGAKIRGRESSFAVADVNGSRMVPMARLYED